MRVRMGLRAEWRRIASITLSAVALGLLGWVFLFWTQQQQPQALQLKIGNASSQKLTFNGALLLSASSLHGAPKESSHHFEGVFEVSSQELALGSMLRLRVLEWTLTDEAGRALFTFKRLPEDNLRYYFSERLSQQDRAELMREFRIDLNDDKAALDRSLFQSTIQLFVSKQGRISELILPLDLKNTLFRHLNQSLAAPFAFALLNRPDELPPLFDGKALRSYWVTEGRYIQPVQYKHRVVRQFGDSIRVLTKMRPSDTENRDRAPVVNRADIEWEYHLPLQRVTELHIHSQQVAQQTLMGSEERASVDLTLDLIFAQ